MYCRTPEIKLVSIITADLSKYGWFSHLMGSAEDKYSRHQRKAFAAERSLLSGLDEMKMPFWSGHRDWECGIRHVDFLYAGLLKWVNTAFSFTSMPSWPRAQCLNSNQGWLLHRMHCASCFCTLLWVAISQLCFWQCISPLIFMAYCVAIWTCLRSQQHRVYQDIICALFFLWLLATVHREVAI